MVITRINYIRKKIQLSMDIHMIIQKIPLTVIHKFCKVLKVKSEEKLQKKICDALYCMSFVSLKSNSLFVEKSLLKPYSTNNSHNVKFNTSTAS